MPFTSIVMPYKENCKTEGEIMTKFKIARMYFAGGEKQNDIAKNIKCHKNTVGTIIKHCRASSNPDIWAHLKTNGHISLAELNRLFNFLKPCSRRPKTNKRSLAGKNKETILEKFRRLNYGPKRLFRHLGRQGYDTDGIYTFGRIKGVYRQEKLKVRKVRTANGERRALYNYEEIGAFEHLQYDTKFVADQHSLPPEIYRRFKNALDLPQYQWTIADAKTKTRFLAWSHSLSSFLGFKFLEFVIVWLRAHGIQEKINIQLDGGAEFCSGSERKLKVWNEQLAEYNIHIKDTSGVKWKQNLIERTHRTDDEEFYCPRGEYIKTKDDFFLEAQNWIIYYNNRINDGIGLCGLSPQEKLQRLGICEAKQICNFPCLILEDFFKPFQIFFNTELNQRSLCQKSQNVLTPYQNF